MRNVINFDVVLLIYIRTLLESFTNFLGDLPFVPSFPLQVLS